ncbi:antibiotic biosynthesis monooxygenase family protein [Tomitella biformata]|uniref:antibiotic biosynthesis monooxygenase family protein n=1 Tax=Tomitella biformata TaxID=630403 RepID=UPI000466A6B6|nr:antibiotic biosynthesis monooxygenase [Tomitella biformata]
MIHEHAVLNIDVSRAEEFEAAFEEAAPLISASAGFQRMTVSRCVETPGRYLLLVAWESVAAHNEGFRGSPAYQQWRELLHQFYDPMPLVEHYEVVLEADPA